MSNVQITKLEQGEIMSETIDQKTGEVVTTAIRPIHEILRELKVGTGEMFLDAFAVAMNEANVAVRDFQSPASITIKLTIKPFHDQAMVNPVVLVSAEMTSKLPKPANPQSIFYLDGDGNALTYAPTKRERDLEFAVAKTTTA
jgi:hypothetical protein